MNETDVPTQAAPTTATAAPRNLQVLLIQVRDHRGAELHEQQCFVDRLALERERLACVNVVSEGVPSLARALASDLVVLGGAGAHSAYVDYPFTAPLVDLVRELAERGRPFFGSCFGHQFLGRAMGGTVVHDPEHEEIGTFEVELSAQGAADPLFAGFPRRFTVHLGHHDRIDGTPAELVTLASSQRCEQQVVRVAGKPVYGSQFHCEMTEQHMRERVLMYASEYMPGEDPLAELGKRLHPTPFADGLLQRFVDVYL